MYNTLDLNGFPPSYILEGVLGEFYTWLHAVFLIRVVAKVLHTTTATHTHIHTILQQCYSINLLHKQGHNAIVLGVVYI